MNENLNLERVNKMYPSIPSITPLFKEKEEQGVAKIVRFEYKERNDVLGNLRYIRDGNGFMRMYDGHYTRLVVDGTLMMSDTSMERLTNEDFVIAANGKVFIAGLGLGLIIQAILRKPEVTEVVVVEKYQDVIDLVAPKFNDPRLKVICADIFEYKPAKDEIYDTVYFDIWPEISQNNLKEMATLSRKFIRNINRSNPKWWRGSWMQKYLQKEAAKDRRSSSWYW